jgi:hypothetical protein
VPILHFQDQLEFAGSLFQWRWSWQIKRQDVLEGTLIVDGKNTWALPESLVKLVAHLRDRHAHRSASDEAWREARAAAVEIRNRQRLAELVPTCFLGQILDDCLGRLRTDFSGLPAMFTRNLVERRRLDDLLRDCLTRLADHFERKGAELREGAIRAANRGRTA